MAHRQHSYTLPAERLTSNSNASQEHGSAPKHANRTGHTNMKTQTRRNFNTIVFYTQKPLHSFIHRESFYAYNVFLYTEHLFYTQRQLHREFVAQRGPYTEKVAQNCLHREPFHTDFLTQKGFYRQKLVRGEVFTQRSFYSESLFYTQKFWRTEVFAQRSFYAEKPLHGEVFTCSSAGFYTVKRYTAMLLLKRSVYPWNLPRTKCKQKVWLQNRILAPKRRKNNFEAFIDGISKEGTSQRQM